MLGGAVGTMPESPLVQMETITIKGVDGNDIPLIIHTPKDVTGPIPCVFHIHGGGMGLMSATNAMYSTVRNMIALRGMAVIGVEFRNCTVDGLSFSLPVYLDGWSKCC